MNSDSQILESYVPVYDVIPEKWEDARGILVEQLKKITTAVNSREIGFFLDEEVLSGKSFIPGSNIQLDGFTSQQFRTVLRKVVDCGAMPNATTKLVPHGINFDDNFTLVQMWGSATNPVNLVAFSFPYADPVSVNNSVGLFMDSTNIRIITGINFSQFSRTFVVIEYMQEL